MSTTAAPTTRTRVLKASAVETGAHTACLRRGRVYIIAGKNGQGDLVFERGQVTPVSPGVFEHLAEHAVDQVTLREPGGRITDQRVRKFALRDAAGKLLPKLHSQTVTVDGEPVIEEDQE